MMKQLFSVLCITGILTLTGCSSDKSKNDMMPESVETPMNDDNDNNGEMNMPEETSSEEMPDMDDDSK